MRRWSLSDLALDRPITFGMSIVAALLVGVLGFWRMPLSYLPANTAPRLAISVWVQWTSPEVLEREVIRPLEREIASVRDLQRIQVGSGSWGVTMNLDFRPETDLEARKVELRDRIERIRGDFPEFVRTVTLETASNLEDPTLEIEISSGTDLAQDFYLIDEHIVQKIERIPGVARTQLDGVAPHELEIAVDLDAASTQGISLAALGEAVVDEHRGRSLGHLLGPDLETGVRSPRGTATPDRYAEVPLQRGQTMHFARLGEVADVTTHPKDERRARRLNGRRAIQLEVFAQAGASPVAVSRRVRQTMEEIAADPALDGIELLMQEDQGRTILQTLADLRNAGFVGGLLGLAVLGLFLHRLSTTVAASSSLPLSVCATGAVLFLRGDELNCVVMLGLVVGVGMLIDNAVVIVEAIARASGPGVPPLEAARIGASEVSFATIASTLSTIIVFIPLMLGDPSDPASVYLRPVGMTFTIALVASLLVSQTAIPLLMGRWLPPSRRPVRNPVLDRLAASYAWLIALTLRAPRLTVLLGLGLAASAYYPYARLDVQLTGGETQQDNLPIRLQIAGSRSFEGIEKVVVEMENALLGRLDELGADGLSCQYSDHWGVCRLYPAEPFQSEPEYEAFQRRVEDMLPEQVGVEYRLGEQRFSWHASRDRNVVEFALKGEDMGTLLGLSEAVAEHLRTRIPRGDREHPDAGGLDHVVTPFDEGSREVHVRLVAERLQRLGLTPGDVAERISLAFEGLPLGTVRGERGDLDLRLSSRVAERPAEAATAGDGAGPSGLDRLRDLALEIGTGESRRTVPLGSVAEIEIARRPWWVQRVDRQTEARIKVRLFSTDRDANWKVVEDAMADLRLPDGYTWGRGTEWWQEKQANHDMLINLGLCLLLVYAVMASLFESYLQPLGILLTCIIGGFGALWGLWLTHTTLDTTAIVGFFILIGVVVNNGIMLIDKVSQLRDRGVPRTEALARAGRERVRPILMTVTTTILGLIPMLIHHPTLAGIYYHAIAIVVAGGLLTSTFMTLIVLPSTYAMLEGIARSATGATRHARRTFWR